MIKKILLLSSALLTFSNFSFAEKDRGGGDFSKIFGPNSKESIELTSKSLNLIDEELLKFLISLNEFLRFNHEERSNGGPSGFHSNFYYYFPREKMLAAIKSNLTSQNLDPDKIVFYDGSEISTEEALEIFLTAFYPIKDALIQRLSHGTHYLYLSGLCETNGEAYNERPYTPICINLGNSPGPLAKSKVVALAFHEYIRQYINWMTHGDSQRSSKMYGYIDSHLFASIVNNLWPQVNKGILDTGVCKIMGVKKDQRFSFIQWNFDPRRFTNSNLKSSQSLVHSYHDKSKFLSEKYKFKLSSKKSVSNLTTLELKLLKGGPWRNSPTTTILKESPQKELQFYISKTLEKNKEFDNFNLKMQILAKNWSTKTGLPPSSYDDLLLECYSQPK